MAIRIILMALFCHFTSVVSGQVPEIKKELILDVPELSEWRVNRIQKQLFCMDGVHFSGYYKNARCIFITYDPLKMTNEDIVTGMISHLNGKLNVRVVKGYSIYDIIDGQRKTSHLSRMKIADIR